MHGRCHVRCAVCESPRHAPFGVEWLLVDRNTEIFVLKLWSMAQSHGYRPGRLTGCHSMLPRPKSGGNITSCCSGCHCGSNKQQDPCIWPIISSFLINVTFGLAGDGPIAYCESVPSATDLHGSESTSQSSSGYYL
jgi:hypothetical protein